MWQALLKKELKVAWRTRRLWWVSGGATVLTALAVLLGTSEWLEAQKLVLQLQSFGEQRFSAQRPDHPHTIAHQGYLVARPPAPLGFLDSGAEAAYGRWLRLDAHQARFLEGARTAERVRGPGGGRFDLGVWMAVFAPALVLLLGFDLFAGERQRGTWTLLRVARVQPGALLIAKLAGLGFRVSVALVAPLLVGTTMAVMAVGGADPVRLSVWLLLQLLGLLVWSLWTLVASAWADSPKTALGLGLGLWVSLALLVPPVAGALASLFVAQPPPGEVLVKAATWAESAHAATEALYQRAVADVRRRHPDWREGEPPEALDAVMLRLADNEAATQMRGLLAELSAAQAQEARWAAGLGFFSPSGLVTLAGSAWAGSDLAHLEHTQRHYENFRVALMTWFNQWWAKQGQGASESLRFSNFAEAPRPGSLRFSNSMAWSQAWLPMVLLLGLALGLSLLLMRLLRVRLEQT